MLLSFCVLFIACSKETSNQARSTVLSNSILVVKGVLDLQTRDANVASLGIINHRSSYQLCGTSGADLLWPVVLPLSDSSVFPSQILIEGDSLSVEVYLDTTFKKNYNITLVVKEDNVTVDSLSVPNKWELEGKFVFHSGSQYNVSATVQSFM